MDPFCYAGQAALIESGFCFLISYSLINVVYFFPSQSPAVTSLKCFCSEHYFDTEPVSLWNETAKGNMLFCVVE